MLSDWYKTKRLGTYFVVPAGVDVARLELPENIRELLDTKAPESLALDAESHEMELSFDFLGVDDCLKATGYCVVRS